MELEVELVVLRFVMVSNLDTVCTPVKDWKWR